MTTNEPQVNVPAQTGAVAHVTGAEEPQLVVLYDGDGRPVYVPTTDVGLWLARGLSWEPLPDPVTAHDAVQRFGEALLQAARQLLDERSPSALLALHMAEHRFTDQLAVYHRVMNLEVGQAHAAAVAPVELVRRDAQGQVVETIHVDPSQVALYEAQGYTAPRPPAEGGNG